MVTIALILAALVTVITMKLLSIELSLLVVLNLVGVRILKLSRCDQLAQDLTFVAILVVG
jgi:hypothetical protein